MGGSTEHLGHRCHLCQRDEGDIVFVNGLYWCSDTATCNYYSRLRIGVPERFAWRLYLEDSGVEFYTGMLPVTANCHRCSKPVFHYRSAKGKEYWFERQPGGDLLISHDGHVFKAREPLPHSADAYQIHALVCTEIERAA
jgi:hypothetical protein